VIWKTVKINDVCLVTDYVANGSFKSLSDNVKYLTNDGYAILVRLTDFTKGWNGDYKYVDEHAYNFLTKTKLFAGDLIISNVGEPGKTFLVPELDMPMTLGPNSILVRPNNNILNTKYFKYLIDSLYGKSLLDKIISGTTQKKFNKTGFRNLEIPLPPLAEQDRIVAKLDAAFTEIDGAIEGSKKQETEVLKYGYRAITNTLKNLANIYSSKPLNDVVIIQPKKKLALEKISESDDVSFMGMKELGIEQKYTEAINTKPLNEVFKSYQYFEENDVVFAKITPCYQNGKLGIMKNLKNGIGFGSSEFVVLRPNSEVHSEYIYYCLLDETFRKNGTKNMSGAVGHKRVTKDYYFNYQIAVPPLSMQIECIKEFDEIWKHAEIISKLKHKKINELISLKSAILKRELQSSEAA
jgi:type I restriction enzyme S subunit